MEAIFLVCGAGGPQLKRNPLGCASTHCPRNVDILGRKDQSLRQLVGEIARRLPPRSFVVVDHWDGDPYSIGIAHPSDHDRLAYITSDRDVHGRYFMSKELPSDNDLDVFRDAGADQFDNIDALAQAIADHLGAA